MINFSKNSTKDEVLKWLAELPEETHSAPKELVAQGKATAVALIGSLKTNGCQLNLRVNVLNDWAQIEAQVAGRNIKAEQPKVEAPKKK